MQYTKSFYPQISYVIALFYIMNTSFLKLPRSVFHFSQKYVSVNCCGIAIGTSDTCFDLLVALCMPFFIYLTCSLVDISGFAICFVYRIT